MPVCDIPQFVLNPKLNPMKTWVIYYHNVDGVTVYIGMCKYVDIFTCPDVRNNAEWYKMTSGKIVTVIPIEQFEDHGLCKVAWSKLVHTFRPRGNIFSQFKRRMSRVRCIETNVEYDTASEAARMNGLSQSALSNHLNGRPGYDSIHGLTFERI